MRLQDKQVVPCQRRGPCGAAAKLAEQPHLEAQGRDRVPAAAQPWQPAASCHSRIQPQFLSSVAARCSMGAYSSTLQGGGQQGKKVLVALDESSVSIDTLRWAASHVLSPQDELHLVTVLDTAKEQQVNIAETAPVPDTSVKQCSPDPIDLEFSTRFLERVKNEVLGKEKVATVKLTPLSTCIGNAHDIGRTIADYAGREGCDVCVVGSRGLGGFRRAMMGVLGLGSVSEAVLRHAPCTVMIHKVPLVRPGVMGSA